MLKMQTLVSSFFLRIAMFSVWVSLICRFPGGFLGMEARTSLSYTPTYVICIANAKLIQLSWDYVVLGPW